MDIKIFKTESIKGTISAPPSKSYTHRAIFMASIANGTSIIRNPLISGDTDNIFTKRCISFSCPYLPQGFGKVLTALQGWLPNQPYISLREDLGRENSL